MGRPRTPLLSRERVADTALAIIDASGLDALSLERLADELGVKAPSLYYHFRDKAEILAEVARQVLLEAPIPRPRDDDPWTEWFVQVSMSARAVILKHRNAAPLLHEFLARDLLVNLYENAAAYLGRKGIPVERHILILEGLETLTISGAVAEAATKAPDGSRAIFAAIDPIAQPALVGALAANPWSADELFAQSVRSFLVGAAGDQPAPRSGKPKPKTKAKATPKSKPNA